MIREINLIKHRARERYMRVNKTGWANLNKLKEICLQRLPKHANTSKPPQTHARNTNTNAKHITERNSVTPSSQVEKISPEVCPKGPAPQDKISPQPAPNLVKKGKDNDIVPKRSQSQVEKISPEVCPTGPAPLDDTPLQPASNLTNKGKGKHVSPKRNRSRNNQVAPNLAAQVENLIEILLTENASNKGKRANPAAMAKSIMGILSDATTSIANQNV